MPDLLYEKRNGMAWLTLNRPDTHNAATPEMVVLLARAWQDFRDDESMQVAVLTGAGDRAFFVGADLDRLVPILTGARAPEDDWDRQVAADRKLLHTAFLRKFELYKPVIAAINGLAVAGGTEIIQATDIRLAVPTAAFGLAEVRHGLIPSGGSLVRLARQIPYCGAMEILLTGDNITAEDAYRIGLINEIVDSDQLLDRAAEIAKRITRNGPLAVRKIKETVLKTSGLPLDQAFAVEDAANDVIMASEDAREGSRAFMEKRPAAFKGR